MANQSSPIRIVTPNYVQKYRAEVQHTNTGTMEEISLEEFIEELRLGKVGQKLEAIPYIEPGRDEIHLDSTPTNFIRRYGNEVSAAIKAMKGPGKKPLISATKPLIFFGDTGNIVPGDHPTSTGCKPDICVLHHTPSTQDPDAKITPSWCELESVSEVHSTGTTIDESLEQNHAYTIYLLQARPDRTTILTFWAGKSGMCFMIASAMGCKRTPVLSWYGDEGHWLHQLFCAYVYRLYEPHSSTVDPTITRVGVKQRLDEVTGKELRHFVFYIDLKMRGVEESSSGRATYYIAHVGHPIGRRSTVFKNFDNPITIDGIQVGFIKEQYITEDRRFQETEIIEHIHNEGPVPGVIQMLGHQEVYRTKTVAIKLQREVDGAIVEERKKIRIAECDMGVSFIDSPTPRDMLRNAYDLLAVTRYLYSRRKVLHRDISKGNVMIKRNESGPSDGPARHEQPSIPASDLCCAAYLLEEEKKDWTALNITLIDYDHAEILDEKENEERAGRTGTAVFIARAVLRGEPINSLLHLHPGMPDAPDLYRATCPDRMAKFPPSQETVEYRADRGSADLSRNWKHELRHDAESIFWLIFYWIVLAWPVDGKKHPISNDEWSELTKNTPRDKRHTLLGRGRDFAATAIHPDYQPLQPLVEELWAHIQHDPYFAPPGSILHEADYIHEVFQRCILSFLIKHEKSAFLNTAKQEKVNRGVETPPPAHTDGTQAGITLARMSSTRQMKLSGSDLQKTKRPLLPQQSRFKSLFSNANGAGTRGRLVAATFGKVSSFIKPPSKKRGSQNPEPTGSNSGPQARRSSSRIRTLANREAGNPSEDPITRKPKKQRTPSKRR